MQGASATNEVLKRFPDGKARVFVIWEPIVFSDIAVPADTVLQRVDDHRAAQFYDPKHLVSGELRAQMLARGVTGQDYFVKDKYVWDAVAVYAPKVRWDAGSPPQPDFVGAPVVGVSDKLSEYLR